MRRYTCSLLIGLFIVFVLFIQNCTKQNGIEISLPEGKKAEIIFLVGEVFVASGSDSWSRAEIGDTLEEGTRIRTAEDSYCEIVINSGTIFRMKDRSELRLVMLPADERQNKSLLQLLTGEIFVKVEKVAYRSDDNIATRSVNLSVRGTEFLVRHKGNENTGFTKLLVADGSVKARINVKKHPRTDVPKEMRSVISSLERGVKVRGGYKIEVSNRKVREIDASVDEIVRIREADPEEISSLKKEIALVPTPLDTKDKRDLEEMRTLTLSFRTGDTFYLSPNFDGMKDEFVFQTKEFAAEKMYGWKLVILNGVSKVQKTIRNRISEEETHITLPESITWNLVNESGRTVRDGSYVYEFYTETRKDHEDLRLKGNIIVDTKPPQLQISPEETTFSPNGDEIKDSIFIEVQAEKGIEWNCTITTPEGITVKTMGLGSDVPPVFEWDGRGENGNVLPEGVYNITVSGQDPAGNRTKKTVNEITLDVRERSATVDIDRPIFSPNGDEKFDTVTFMPLLSDRSRIDTWDLIVQTEKGDTARRFRGRRYIPETIMWDGRPQQGPAYENLPDELPSGKYTYFLKVIYVSGVNTYSFKKELILDTDPPEVDVEITPPLFSPDGDGENDLLVIRPSVSDISPILHWNATVFRPDGRVFKRFAGYNMPGSELVWDGVSERGRLVGSGDDFYLVFEATDQAYNVGPSEQIPFSIDILVIRTERGLKIQVSNIEFAFNEAELMGEKTYSILERGVDVLKKYKKYSITIEGHTDSTGDPEYNLELSKRRAEAVGQFLIQNGIAPERLSYVGYGSQYPIDTNETMDGRARNRRVEFILVKKK
jgi:outer membrane protein OmpA-like peptidoglycan-associated protein/flagellar hook assembly protein FlgD